MNPIRMPGRQTKPDRSPVIHDIQTVGLEVQLLGERLDNLGNAIKGIVKLMNLRHRAVAKAGIIRRDDVVL